MKPFTYINFSKIAAEKAFMQTKSILQKVFSWINLRITLTHTHSIYEIVDNHDRDRDYNG